jgi:hypothetical protein
LEVKAAMAELASECVEPRLKAAVAAMHRSVGAEGAGVYWAVAAAAAAEDPSESELELVPLFSVAQAPHSAALAASL